MFLSQRRMNEVILYTVFADVVLGFLMKKLHGPHTTLPLALLYLLNIVIILAVYRFWKFPVFEWDDAGFIVYGVTPFNKDRGLWDKVERAGFKAVKDKKGRLREYFVVDYMSGGGVKKTGMVPMDMVGFRDRVKEELLEFLNAKSIKDY
ncbi:MAG: hypothetical protein ABSG42_00950 [Nitrospirota bacterium]